MPKKIAPHQVEEPQAVEQPAAVEQEDAQRIAKEAAAAVAAAEPLKLEEDGKWWRHFGGADLESALQVDPDHGDSPVALIDARYIVELWKRGGKILRRQDLPKEAFIDLETVKRLPGGGVLGDCLRVIAVSHPWQQPDHPDPKEVNLTLLAKVLERFIAEKTYVNGEWVEGGCTYACFFDFMSCFQKGPDGKRTDKEMALFGKALSNMMVWYAHPHALTIKLTRLPEGYPKGFKFPKGMKPNLADYEDRYRLALPTSHSPLPLLTHDAVCAQGLVLLRVISEQPRQGLSLCARPRQV